jgi:6-pyruvoyltetrahydropterin/6-carboxytetrahydropterin synthase
MYEVSIKAQFSGAHLLRNYAGVCEQLHGHNWYITVSVRAEKLNDIGITIDFKDLKKSLYELLEQVDHKFLNEVAPFDQINPSAENLARWLYQGLSGRVNREALKVSRVTVWESESCAAAYYE